MLDRIAQAEQRAAEAEQRARETVDRIVDLGSELARGQPPAMPEPEPPPPEPPLPEPPPPEPATEPPAGPSQADVRAPSSEPHPEGKLNINQATYEDLRGLKLSVTQTGRVLDHRNSLGGFKSLDELDEIAGFPRDLLTELKRKLTL